MTIQYSTQDTYIHDLMQGRRSAILTETSSIDPGKQSWVDPQPASLRRSISPPPTSRRRSRDQKSSTAAVEAGEKDVEDHASFFSQKLMEARRPVIDNTPRLDHQSWIDLYTRNCNDKGHHFVIHQHDHPIAGTHYDLRLQCNATSSISFAVMYGLPGDPNSKRLNRNATETRVHTLWNHLIETASHQTGSMLIWDTGEYSVMPFHDDQKNNIITDEEGDEEDTKNGDWSVLSEPQKLHRTFNQRRIRLRLHGTRLPKYYTISLRLTTENFKSEQPHQPNRKRRRVPPTDPRPRIQQIDYNTTESDSDLPKNPTSNKTSRSSIRNTLSSPQHTESPPHNLDSSSSSQGEQQNKLSTTSQIIATNAYPGATNTINSIHQRRWFLSLDRHRSGFVKLPVSTPNATTLSLGSGPTDTKWIHQHNNDENSRPSTFQVQGRESEHSIITGRLASAILADEGVESFIPRKGWRPVLN